MMVIPFMIIEASEVKLRGLGKKVIKIDGSNEERPLTNFTTSTRSRKYLTFSERFGPRRTPKQGAVPELIVTQYDRFMSDNPNGKPYSRRLKDPDSLYAREARRSNGFVIQVFYF